MAKVGPKEQGGYDPFNAIASSLTALTEPPPAENKTPSPAPGRDRPYPPAPEKPVVVEAPQQPEPQPAADPLPAPEPQREAPVPQEQGRAVPPSPQSEPQPLPATPRVKTVSSASALQITKRFKTTRQEAAQLDAAAIKLGAALGVSIDFSKVTRALWEVYTRHQEDILRNVPEGETWERPANNDAAGLAELDERLVDLVNEGLMVACRRPKNSR